MATKFYFFKTVFEKNRPRMRPLPDQTMPDGKTALNTAFNSTCSQELRNKYPIGTIYGSVGISEANGYYTIPGELSVIVIANTSGHAGVDSTEIPSPDMVKAYEALTGTKTAEPAAPTPRKETFLSKLMANPAYEVPDIMDGFYVPEEKWYLLIRNIKNSINTIITGPTGTGKTELFALICKRLKIPFNVFDMGAMIDPIAGLLGVHRLQEGKSVFDYAKFTKVIDKAGVSILDELSRAPASSNNILFPTLDSRRCLPVEIACGDEDRNIELHADHCIVATANIGGEYTGTNQLDAALKNRFFQVELEYMPPELEIQVLCARTGIDKSEAMLVAKVAEAIRRSYINSDISESVSTRETIAISQCIRDGFSPLQSLELCLLPKYQQEDLGAVKQILASR